ncbi:hypothetical protein [Elongatibacter sediminis]|uniref:YtxH domain-containing protein n=1 Tax=Elongatibacter sediminis TaxID=3119006 RepID=A0AAW9RBW2_9GAMM
MKESTPPSGRRQLARDATILQLKLLIDGFRDALLIPLSLGAALIGLIRGGPNADREYQRVLKLGRRSDRWINLFGHQPPSHRSHPGGSLDTLLDRVEDVVTEQYRKGRDADEARAAIRAALARDEPVNSGEPATGCSGNGETESGPQQRGQ